jgi:hypothetical protein
VREQAVDVADPHQHGAVEPAWWRGRIRGGVGGEGTTFWDFHKEVEVVVGGGGEVGRFTGNVEPRAAPPRRTPAAAF